MKKSKIDDDSELRPEYNLRNLRVRRVGPKRSGFGNSTIHLAPDVTDKSMNEPIFSYDEISDTLTISFFPGESAIGIELNDNILLRINKQEHYAVSLSIFNYSILAQKTEAGLRSVPLTGLEELSSTLYGTVLKILQMEPLSTVLAVSTYTPSLLESVPIVTIRNSELLTPA